jgi:hypothetical protein
VKYGNFDAIYPFALGEALNEANIEVFVYDIDSGGTAPGETNIDVVEMTLNEGSFGFEDGHVYKRSGIRDFSYSTLGNCGLGDGETYGGNCFLFKPALTNLFGDKMYRDGDTLETGDNNDVLDSPSLTETEDTNDNAVDDRSKGENESEADGDTLLDGDLYVPGAFDLDLTTFDIDADGNVELPVQDTTADIVPGFAYTLAQVVKMIITHELGHAIGARHDSVQGGLMYEFMTDFRHDEAFSDESKQSSFIHNN